MNNILVVCYSYTGISRRVAQLICSHHGWPLGEITEPTPRGTWRCILDSLLRRRPEIRYRGPTPMDFHTVLLISPIWMYRLAGPMRSFIVRYKDNLNQVAVIETMNAASTSNALAEIGHLLGHRLMETAAFNAQEIENGSAIARLLAFADTLELSSTASKPVRHVQARTVLST